MPYSMSRASSLPQIHLWPVGARLAREAESPVYLRLRVFIFAGKPRSNKTGVRRKPCAVIENSRNRRRIEQGDVVVQTVVLGPGLFLAAGHVQIEVE